MEIKSYCLNDFDICEEHYSDYFKAKNKNDSNFYYIKKYSNHNLSKENIEKIKKVLLDLSDITKLKLYGLFEEDSKQGKDLYLIFEYFEGKLVCSNNDFQNYEIWNIAQNILQIFEKLSEKGIKFNKNKAIDVFEVNIKELKVNIFELINTNYEEDRKNNAIEENKEKNETEENKEKNEIEESKEKNDTEEKMESTNNSGILYNLALILEEIIKKNYITKGLINDLKNNKIDILTIKTLCNLYFRYSLYLINNSNDDDIIFDKGMIYIGNLKNEKPDGIGMLVNEFGIIYKGEFKEGKISGKGKLYIYDKNLGNLNKKNNNHFGICCKKDNYPFKNYNNQFCSSNGEDYKFNKNLMKIYEGSFLNEIKNGNYIEYNKNNSKIFEGEYENDMKNGKGIEYRDGYKIYEGEFKDNIKDGIGIEYYDGKKKYEGNFKNGKKEGTGTLYNDQSIIRYVGNFENNYFHGKGKLYYDNGKIQYFGNFENSFFSGEGAYYDDEGESTKVINGLPIVNRKYFNIYYNSGKIHYTLSIKNKKIYGKEFDMNGRLIYTGDFRIRNMKEKEKETINLDNYRDKNEYLCLIKEGNGTNYNDGGKALYKGNFKNNYYNGKGILYFYKYENEIYLIYSGIYLGGKNSGYGKQSKIIEYEGKFINGNYEGMGIKYNSKGEEEFNGTFKNGQEISGFKTSEDYIGQIKNKVKEGKGKIYINKILRFDGTFKNDKFIEGVVYTVNSKKFFEGTISDNNIKIGKFFNDDNNYDGTFEEFLKKADYIVDFTNDCTIIFEGEYKNGMKCGKGKDYITGYEGEYLYDMYHGKGKYNNDMEGEFKNGKKTGYWKESDFVGEYKDGLRNGKGVEDSWNGYYVNNYLHGERKKESQKKIYYFGEEANILNLNIENNCIYFNNIKEYEGDLKNGIKEGQGTEYYKNNKKRYEGSFKNGKHHGKGKEFYENGILKYEGEFNQDKYDKIGIQYDENGQKIYEGDFKNGKYHGKGKLFRKGKLIYEGDFIDDKLQGKGKEFDEEGKVLYSGDFQNNAYNGFGSRFLVRPYEGYWTNNRPDKLKQGFYLIGKGLKLVS